MKLILILSDASSLAISSHRIQNLEDQIGNLTSTLAAVLTELAGLKETKASAPIVHLSTPRALHSMLSPSLNIATEQQYPSARTPVTSAFSPVQLFPSSPSTTTLGGISVPLSPPHPRHTPPPMETQGHVYPLLPQSANPWYPPSSPIRSSPRPFHVRPSSSLRTSPVRPASPPRSPMNAVARPSLETTHFSEVVRPHSGRRASSLRKLRRTTSDIPAFQVTYGGGMTFDEASSRTVADHVELPDVEERMDVKESSDVVNIIPLAASIDMSVVGSPIVPLVDLRGSSQLSSAVPHSPPPAPVMLDLDYGMKGPSHDEEKMDNTEQGYAGGYLPSTMSVLRSPAPIPVIPTVSRTPSPLRIFVNDVRIEPDHSVQAVGSTQAESSHEQLPVPSAKRRRSRVRASWRPSQTPGWAADVPQPQSSAVLPDCLPWRPPHPQSQLKPRVSFNVPSALSSASIDPPDSWGRRPTEMSGTLLSMAPDYTSGPGPFGATANSYLPIFWQVPSPTTNPTPTRLRRPRSRSRSTNALESSVAAGQRVSSDNLLQDYNVTSGSQSSYLPQIPLLYHASSYASLPPLPTPNPKLSRRRRSQLNVGGPRALPVIPSSGYPGAPLATNIRTSVSSFPDYALQSQSHPPSDASMIPPLSATHIPPFMPPHLRPSLVIPGAWRTNSTSNIRNSYPSYDIPPLTGRV